MQKYGTHISLALLLGMVGLLLWQGASRRSAEQALVGASAGEFRLPLLGTADQVGPQDYRGRVVLLDFWALYCDPCRDAMPDLQRLHETFHDREFTLLSVNVDPLQPGVDRPRVVTEYLQRHGYTFPVVLDYGPASEEYSVTSIPHVVVIDQAGQVRYVHMRAMGFRQLRDEIDELL